MNLEPRLETLYPLLSRRFAVAIDPGRQRCGCVVMMYEPLMAVILAKRLTNEELFDLLWELEPDVIFFEGFRLYPWLANDKRWDHFPEIRTIGSIEEIARVNEIPIVEIMPAHSKRVIPNRVLYLLRTWSNCHHTTDAFRVFWTVILQTLDKEELDERDT